MELEDMEPLAQDIKNALAPFCAKIDIAGSIRRRKPVCKDIDIVCVPMTSSMQEFVSQIRSWKKLKGEPTGKYTQREITVRIAENLGKSIPAFVPIKLEIYISEPGNFGNILVIRTGNDVFSKWLMGTQARKAGYVHKEGFLWKRDKSKLQPYGDVKIECPTEEDVFKVLGIEFIPPDERSWE